MTETRPVRLRLPVRLWALLQAQRQARTKLGGSMTVDAFVSQAVEVYLGIEQARLRLRSHRPTPGADEDLELWALVIREQAEKREAEVAALDARRVRLEAEVAKLTKAVETAQAGRR